MRKDFLLHSVKQQRNDCHWRDQGPSLPMGSIDHQQKREKDLGQRDSVQKLVIVNLIQNQTKIMCSQKQSQRKKGMRWNSWTKLRLTPTAGGNAASWSVVNRLSVPVPAKSDERNSEFESGKGSVPSAISRLWSSMSSPNDIRVGFRITSPKQQPAVRGGQSLPSLWQPQKKAIN